ncbi:MAG: hypothetical protein MZV64_62485 [Ignavibacteriales bacterium]|nr:hypothetical protein [Ignavibacteriales bacterium]
MPFYLRRFPARTVQTAVVDLFRHLAGISAQQYPKTRSELVYYNGETSEYNLYNTRAQNESEVREFVAVALPISPEDKVYSNYGTHCLAVRTSYDH